MSIIGIAVAE